MLRKISFGLTVCVAATGALAQATSDINANPTASAYMQDSRGVITRSGHGLCWRTGYWTPAYAVTGCDGALVPPVAKPIAPDVVAPVAQAPIAPSAPKRCDFSVTLDSDQTFAFNKAVLSAAAQGRLDAAVLPRLENCAKPDLILITGHTDRLGSHQYNQKLSEKRADAVAAYLKSKGVAATIDTLGAGKTQSIKACSDKLSRAALIECMAPNRRVSIEVRGIAR